MGEYALGVTADVIAQHSQAADQHGHLWRAEGKQLRLVQQQGFRSDLDPSFDEVTKTIGSRFQQAKRLDIGLLLGGVSTTG
ncbi:hypothetical protein D3C78_1352810 [compost metagenome]